MLIRQLQLLCSLSVLLVKGFISSATLYFRGCLWPLLTSSALLICMYSLCVVFYFYNPIWKLPKCNTIILSVFELHYICLHWPQIQMQACLQTDWMTLRCKRLDRFSNRNYCPKARDNEIFVPFFMHSHIIQFSHDSRMYIVWMFRDRTDALLMIIREADPIVGGCEINDFWRWFVELNSLEDIVNSKFSLELLIFWHVAHSNCHNKDDDM